MAKSSAGREESPVTGAAPVQELRAKVSAHDARLARHVTRLDTQLERLDRQAARLDKLEAWVATATPKLSDLNGSYTVVQHQVAALEERLGALVVEVSTPEIVGDDADRAEARNILDEVRSEHARIRARFQALVAYEERIRRLEERAAQQASTQ